MNKEQQIKDTAKIVCKACVYCGEERCDRAYMHCGNCVFAAEWLYGYGYRKLPAKYERLTTRKGNGTVRLKACESCGEYDCQGQFECSDIVKAIKRLAELEDKICGNNVGGIEK